MIRMFARIIASLVAGMALVLAGAAASNAAERPHHHHHYGVEIQEGHDVPILPCSFHHGRSWKNGSKQLKCATHHVHHRAVVYFRHIKGGNAFVRLNNGAEFFLVPCAYDELVAGKPCYWNAETRGNGLGRSFVNVYNRTIYLPHHPRYHVEWHIH